MKSYIKKEEGACTSGKSEIDLHHSFNRLSGGGFHSRTVQLVETTDMGEFMDLEPLEGLLRSAEDICPQPLISSAIEKTQLSYQYRNQNWYFKTSLKKPVLVSPLNQKSHFYCKTQTGSCSGWVRHYKPRGVCVEVSTSTCQMHWALQYRCTCWKGLDMLYQ